jgi:hypothetical protein
LNRYSGAEGPPGRGVPNIFKQADAVSVTDLLIAGDQQFFDDSDNRFGVLVLIAADEERGELGQIIVNARCFGLPKRGVSPTLPPMPDIERGFKG